MVRIKKIILLLLQPRIFFGLVLISLLPALYIFMSLPNTKKALPVPTSETVSSSLMQSFIARRVYAAGIDYAKFTKPPFNLPEPNGDSDIKYSAETIARSNTLGGYVQKHLSYIQSKFPGHPEYVDPFASVIWNVAIEGTYANPFEWNCNDNDANTVNQLCPTSAFTPGGWQVNGSQVSQAASHIVDDFKQIYGNADAATVKSVGDKIIAASNAQNITEPKKYAGITRISSFPSKDLGTIRAEAIGGNSESQNLLGILLMDPELGAVVVTREVAGDMANKGGDWVAAMTGYGYSDFQVWSNRASALAAQYSGSIGDGGGGAGGAGSFNLSLVLKPKDNDSYVLNVATAQAIGGAGGGGGNGAGGTGNTSDVVNWAQQITAGLKTNLWTYYNDSRGIDLCQGAYCVSQRSGSGEDDLYWCTYLVVDAYNLAGHAGMTVDRQGSVQAMAEFFKGNGFLYVRYDDSTGQAALGQVKPGFAFFLESERGVYNEKEHTGLVQTISIDGNGNGSLVTYESNSDQISHTFTIANWQVLNTFYPLTGFGGV